LRLTHYPIVYLLHFLVYSDFILLHEEEQKSNLYSNFGEVLISPLSFVVLVLSFEELADEGLAFADEVCLLESDFNHFGELSALEDSQVVLFVTLDEDEGMRVYFELADEFDVPVEFFEGALVGRDGLVGLLNDLAQTGHLLLQHGFKQLLLILLNAFLVV
jgi:hypothetical protein